MTCSRDEADVPAWRQVIDLQLRPVDGYLPAVGSAGLDDERKASPALTVPIFSVGRRVASVSDAVAVRDLLGDAPRSSSGWSEFDHGSVVPSQGSKPAYCYSDSDAAVEHAPFQDFTLVCVKIKDWQAVRTMPTARDVAVARDAKPVCDLAGHTTRPLALGCEFDPVHRSVQSTAQGRDSSVGVLRRKVRRSPELDSGDIDGLPEVAHLLSAHIRRGLSRWRRRDVDGVCSHATRNNAAARSIPGGPN